MQVHSDSLGVHGNLCEGFRVLATSFTGWKGGIGNIMNKTSLKLYVWEDVMTDYSSGIAFALAHNIRQARELIILSQHGKEGVKQYRKWRKDHKGRSTYLWDALEAPYRIITEPEGFAIAGGS